MIGYWFLILLMLLPLFIIGVMLQFIPVVGPFIFMVGFYLAVFSLWAGYYLYMNNSYHNKIDDFSLFFKGFPFGYKLLASYFLRFLILLPLNAIPYYFIYTEAASYGLPSDIQNQAEMLNFYKSLLQNSSFLISYSVLIVGNLLAAILFQFSSELIVNSNIKVVDSLIQSVKAVWSHVGFFIGLFFLLVLMNMGGYLFCGLGLIFTIPYSLCISHVLFQKLFVQKMDSLQAGIENFGGAKEDVFEDDF